MKLEIYEKTEEQSEITIQLGLEYEKDCVNVVTRCPNGEVDWILLTILPNGKFERCGGIEENSEFQVNKDGKIKEEK